MDKPNRIKTGLQKRILNGKTCTKERFRNPPDPGRRFKGLGVAKRYCRMDSIGDNFVQGAMTKYWAFARSGAWRNPEPTGGPYVCEQCRLDARSGNDATLTMQAVTVIELTPADVCADCGARLLEERGVKDQA